MQLRFVRCRLRWLTLFAAGVSLAGSSLAQGQPSVSANLGTRSGDAGDLYARVRARIFALQEPRPVDEVFLLIVRIHPNGLPESQIAISQRKGSSDATVDIVQLSERLEDFLTSRRGGERNPEVLAKQTPAIRRRIQVTSDRSFTWQKEFLSEFSLLAQDLSKKAQAFYDSGAVDITLDADSYDFRYVQGLTVLSAHVSEPGPMADWAISLKIAVQGIAGRQ